MNFLILSILTTIVQTYDYALFGITSHYLAKEFMPDNDIQLQLTLVFIVLSISVIAKPIGSVIFGYLGDKYGRTTALRNTIILSFFASIGISILPSYSSIGILATILLSICRMLTLAGISGETDGMRIYISEKFSYNKQHFSTGIVNISMETGVVIAMLACLLEVNSQYYFRLLFLLGGFCNLIIFFLRRILTESNKFIEYKKSESYKILSDISFFQLCINYKKLLLLGIIIYGCMGGIYQFCVIFLFNLLKMPNINITGYSSSVHIYGIIIFSISSILAGYLIDKFLIYRKIITIFALIFIIILLAIQLYYLRLNYFPTFPFLLTCFIMPYYELILQTYYRNIINTGVCYRISSFGHSIGSILLSTPTAFICMFLYNLSNNIALTLAYPCILASILFCTVLTIKMR